MKKYTILMALLLSGCGTKEVNWSATGTFEATEVTVSAEEIGRLVSLHIEQGQLLTQNEKVGLIDTVQLHLKQLQLLSNRSGAMNRRQDIAKQIAATQQQIAWQTQERARYETLVSQNAATKKQVDDIVNQIAVLNKQLIAQQSSLERANQGLTDEGQAIEVQIAQVADQLQKCRIVSPIAGTVLVKFAEQGEYATSGKPLFTVANMEQIFLRAYITADQLTQLKLGQNVKVYADFGADQQREYNGRVEWIAAKSEFTPKSIQTRDERANLVYAVKIAVKNDGYLKIGMYGQVVL